MRALDLKCMSCEMTDGEMEKEGRGGRVCYSSSAFLQKHILVTHGSGDNLSLWGAEARISRLLECYDVR